MHPPRAPEDEDNIMAALEQSDRVYSINLTVSSSLLKKLSTISEPFSELEELVLLSQDNVQLTLLSTFWWGHRLRTLHSTRIAFPSLPQLLLPSQDLVDLQLHEIPGVGYFSPEAFANALCGMTQLEILSLHFLSSLPRRNYLALPPPPGDRVVLPALICFKYRGISKYLDSLVARIDAPRLGDIDITFFSQPTLDALQLGLFIDRIDTRGSPLQAEILSSGGAISISITFTQPGSLTRLGLKIPCEQLDWQLSSISQICDQFSSFLFSVEALGIKTIGPSSVPDDVDEEQWLRLICAFDGAKDFRVSGELATDILRALRLADEGHKTVLPALRNLHVRGHTPMLEPSLRDSAESFVTQRRLSSHPVQIYYLPTDADYQALLASIPSDSSVMTAEATRMLPRFWQTPGADLEAHRVPSHIVAFVEQHRDNLQRAAQDQNGFRAGLTSTKNLPLDNRVQINQASAFQGMARPPPQLIPNHTQLQLSRQALAQAQGKPNTSQPTQLINNGVGLLARPPTAQSMGASSMSSMGTQITGAGSNGGAQSQSGSMSAPLTQGGMNGVGSSSILTQSAGAVPIRRPTAEEVNSAKRWVEEQRRTAFNRSSYNHFLFQFHFSNLSHPPTSGFEGVASSPVPENEIPEYIRNLERLDMVLGNIERYIHIAFAALRKEDVVRRMFTMVS